MNLKKSKKEIIYVAGHSGLVGSALIRFIRNNSDHKIITRSHNELDLTNQSLVREFFHQNQITQVYLAAAKVGGILANNNFPADFICKNILIQTNVIESAFINRIKKLLFLGSSCIYPKFSRQPIHESELLKGSLEKTNEPYAVAKIAGIKLCESFNRQYSKSHGIDFRSIMPTNIYGPGDNYHPENSHVIPALIKRIHEAKIDGKKSVNIWGTGNVRREFLYVDDLASASFHIMNLDKKVIEKHIDDRCSHINIGTGKDITIKELALTIKNVINYDGELHFDVSKPDGTPRKLLDVTKINELGWRYKTELIDGLKLTYKDFNSNKK